MNKKWLPYLLILVLGAGVFFIKKCQEGNLEKQPGTTSKNQKDPPTSPDRDRGFDRRISYLEYTLHASCRMGCRHISQEEVKQIMQEGKINYNKSNVKANPCPSYALEGITRDDQRVRIVFGQCDSKTKVITVIDLDRDWICDCPGDDDKYKNKN